MDTDRMMEVAPHYAAMLILIFLVPAVVRIAVGEIGFWVEIGIIAAIAFAYRPVVMWLDIGPDAWER